MHGRALIMKLLSLLVLADEEDRIRSHGKEAATKRIRDALSLPSPTAPGPRMAAAAPWHPQRPQEVLQQLFDGQAEALRSERSCTGGTVPTNARTKRPSSFPAARC